MMCGVIGVRSAKATQYAVDLGLAMQLTNICRDVREDARLNRVYIPSEILKRHGMSSTQLIEGRFTGGQLAGAVDEVLELAERLYNRSLFGMQYIPFRSRVAILVARRVYREIGRKLRRVHDSNPFHGRTVVSFSGKCVQGILGVIDAFRPTTLGLWSPPDPSLPMEDSWTELARPQRLESGQLKLALLEDRLP